MYTSEDTCPIVQAGVCSILMGGSIPYDCAFGALIVRSLSITKKLTKEKMRIKPKNLNTPKPYAQPPQQTTRYH